MNAPRRIRDMNVVIFAGGLGTRLAEETSIRPKPMVEIGGHPMLWHIMKLYGQHGFRNFYVALGYKGEVIKQYFLEYFALAGDITVDLSTGAVEPQGSPQEDWVVRLKDTGLTTITGGRLRRLRPCLEKETFLVTYGDGVSDVDITALVAFHHSRGRIATITCVRPPARFGEVYLEDDRVVSFEEKPKTGEGYISGGFMVFEPAVFDYLEGDDTGLELHVLGRLADEGQLSAYRHDGFWQCMDNIRDKRYLESLWASGDAPWKTWE